MCIRFIIFSLLMRLSQTSISNLTIASDANEIVRLNEVLISSSPDIFQQSHFLVCKMIDNCCPHIKTRLDNYEIRDVASSNALMEACLNNHRYGSLLESCPILHEFVKIAENEDFHKYINVLGTVAGEIEIPDISIPSMCSSDELYVTLCNRTERYMMVSCEHKKFAYVAQHRSDHDYQTYARQTKQNIRLMINVITKAFPKERLTTIITTSNAAINPQTNILLLGFFVIKLVYFIF